MGITILEIECIYCKKREKAIIDLDFNSDVSVNDIASKLGFIRNKNGGYTCKKCRACNCC